MSVEIAVLPSRLLLRIGFFRMHYGELACITKLQDEFDELTSHVVFSDEGLHEVDVLPYEQYPERLYDMEGMYRPTVAEYEIALNAPHELVVGAALEPPCQIVYRRVDAAFVDSDTYDAGIERVLYHRV